MAIQRINLGTAPSGTGGDTNRSAFTKIDDNFADSANAASRLVGTAAGNVMEVGAFGIGLQSTSKISSDIKIKSGLVHIPDMNSFGFESSVGQAYGVQFVVGNENKLVKYRTKNYQDRFDEWQTVYSTANTTKDSNGFLKGASPIVKLFADKIELNDEAKQQKITFEKLGVGDYLVKGSTGFAQEGWYIEMPKDANGNVLVAVIYEQLANNDISVKTYAKKFDEETGDIVANTAKPRDIPSTRWIDLRLQALPQDDVQPLDTDETVNTNAE